MKLFFIKRFIQVSAVIFVLGTAFTPQAAECSRDDDCGGDMVCSDGWCIDQERKNYIYNEVPTDKFHFGFSLSLPVPLGDFADAVVDGNKWNSGRRDLLQATSASVGYGAGFGLDFPVVRDLYLGVKIFTLESRNDGEKIKEFHGDDYFIKVGSWYNVSFLPSIKYMPNLSSDFEIYFSALAGLNMAFAPSFFIGTQYLDTVDTERKIITSVTEVEFDNPAFTFASGGTIGIRIVEALNIGVSFLYLGGPEFKAKITSGPGPPNQYNSSKPIMILLVTAGIDF